MLKRYPFIPFYFYNLKYIIYIVSSIDQLMFDPNASQPREGLVSGYMDDLQWAAPFERVVQVIKFVRDRGPAYVRI